MLQFQKEIDFQEAKKQIEECIKEQDFHFEIWQKVMSILKENFEGKNVTKRIETKLKKELPEYTLYLENGSLIIIHIWGNGIDYNNRINIYLRIKENEMLYNKYNHALTVENSGYFPLIPERNEKLKAILKNDGKLLKKLVNNWNKALKELQNINREAENFEYPISSIFDVKN